MKKLLVVFIYLLAANALIAQTNSGNFFLGLSSSISLNNEGNIMTFGYSSTTAEGSSNEYETVGLNLSPKVGYFLANNFAAGLDLNIGISNSKNDNFERSSSLINIGPFFRYYIPSSTLLPYIELGGSLGTINSSLESNYDNNDDSENILGMGLGAGISTMLSEKAALDLMFGYNYYSLENTKTHMISFKVGFTLFLGEN